MMHISSSQPYIDLTAWGDLAIAADLVVTIDFRKEIGDHDIMEMVRFPLAAGKVVAMWDSAEVLSPFALGQHGDLVMVCNSDGERGNFATLEAALKFGLINFAGYGRDR